ncbi:MAG: methyltransferase [Balneolia bacterium]|nr:methyltransferase [Balneolia bacterium]
MSTYKRHEHTFEFNRYPPTSNRSLRPWSAADELLLTYFDEYAKSHQESESPSRPAVYHDRFGFLSTALQSNAPFVLYNFSSQDKSIRQNLKQNKFEVDESAFYTPLTDFPEPVDIVLMKIPKSMDLFRLYLHHAHKNLSDSPDAAVYCGFMTRHFTPQMLSIADEYFDTSEQSRAKKKARVLMLKGKKSTDQTGKPIANLVNEVEWKPSESGLSVDKGEEPVILKQYFGVFSSDGVDMATSLLLKNLKLKEDENTALDLGCGNGIIALALKMQKPEAEIQAIDDDFLAAASARMNTNGKADVHHYDSPEMFPDAFFDLVVTNPPSHLGHENNIEVSIHLFEQAAKKIKKGGRLLVVASKHLNYSTHITRRYIDIKKIAEDEKFELIEAIVA